MLCAWFINPSGVIVTVSESRFQHQNKKLAKERFIKVFEQHQLKVMQEQAESYWKNHLDLERGNPVKVFKGRGFEEVS